MMMTSRIMAKQRLAFIFSFFFKQSYDIRCELHVSFQCTICRQVTSVNILSVVIQHVLIDICASERRLFKC